MSGARARATDRRNDITAHTVLQASWKTDIHSLYSANILHSREGDPIECRIRFGQWFRPLRSALLPVLGLMMDSQQTRLQPQLTVWTTNYIHMSVPK